MIQQKLIAVTSASQSATHAILNPACRQRDVEFVPVYPAHFDYTCEQNSAALDMVYRIKPGKAAARVEQFLIASGAISFYKNTATALSRPTNAALLRAYNNIPTPRTIYSITTNREVLHGYIEYLGGFPLVVKVPGGSHGRGVMRIDSTEALYSSMDFLDRLGRQAYLMEYVPDHTMIRLIVIGHEAVAGYRKISTTDDFRTNSVGASTETVLEFSEELKTLAIQSVQIAGLEFGGVDILVTAEGNNFVAEANYPCHFERVQRITGVDIAGKMVDYLLAKNAKD